VAIIPKLRRSAFYGRGSGTPLLWRRPSCGRTNHRPMSKSQLAGDNLLFHTRNRGGSSWKANGPVREKAAVRSEFRTGGCDTRDVAGNEERDGLPDHRAIIFAREGRGGSVIYACDVSHPARSARSSKAERQATGPRAGSRGDAASLVRRWPQLAQLTSISRPSCARCGGAKGAPSPLRRRERRCAGRFRRRQFLAVTRFLGRSRSDFRSRKTEAAGLFRG
jgi:hypothetical protein